MAIPPIALQAIANAVSQNGGDIQDNGNTEAAESQNGGGLFSGLLKGGGLLDLAFGSSEIPKVENVEASPVNYTAVYVLAAVFIAAIAGLFLITKN